MPTSWPCCKVQTPLPVEQSEQRRGLRTAL